MEALAGAIANEFEKGAASVSGFITSVEATIATGATTVQAMRMADAQTEVGIMPGVDTLQFAEDVLAVRLLEIGLKNFMRRTRVTEGSEKFGEMLSDHLHESMKDFDFSGSSKDMVDAVPWKTPSAPIGGSGK